MKDLGQIMKQAQAMQQKMLEEQARLAETDVEGMAGGGMVRLTMSAVGDLKAVVIDESLMQDGEGELVADLIVAAHADAKRKADEAQQSVMREAAGPLAGMGGIPGMPSF